MGEVSRWDTDQLLCHYIIGCHLQHLAAGMVSSLEIEVAAAGGLGEERREPRYRMVAVLSDQG